MRDRELDADGVREYRPMSKRTGGTRFADNYSLSPEASEKLMSRKETDDQVVHLDGGVMLEKSEILDFSEGTDSQP